MRRKALALLLVLAMVLAMCPMALAAGTSDVRKTNFFTDYNADIRTDLKFSDIKAETCDMDALLATAKEVLTLMGDPANEAVVEEKVTEITDAYMWTLTWMNVAQVRAYQKYYSSDALWDIYYQNSDDNYELWDIAAALIGEVLQSPCSGFLKKLIPNKADQDYYIDYAAWIDLANYERATNDGSSGSTSDSNDPYTMNANLQNEYWDKLYETYTVTYEGKTYTEDDVYTAEYNGKLDYETGNSLLREISRKQNEALGSIYIEMLPYRAQIAADYGYSNYAENCYDYIYGYEYTPAETRAFEQALKTYIAPLYQELGELANDLDYYSGVLAADYTGDKGMDLIEPYLGQMSSELLESFQYMREHKMVDVSPMSTKYYNGAYTTYLYNYGTAFVFSGAYASDGIYNFDTIVHEFGHYNADYYGGMGFYDYFKSMDICEVHSQGLELLMTHYYPEIFGEDAEDVMINKMYNMLFTLLYEALLDEFEQYAYSTPGVTLQQLNEKYCSLEKEYGLIPADDPRTDMFGWVTVTHLFQTPGYVISYSTSLAGAYNFWLDAQTDFFSAVDDYLEFCALPGELSFYESFEKIGMPNPLSAQYVQDLSVKLKAAISENKTPASEDGFTDLVPSAWYTDAVNYVVDNGLMQGVSSTKFDPNGTLNRAMLAQILYNMAGQPEVTESGLFTDVADSAWYADAINWAAANEIVTGYENGTFQPTKAITRQELAVMLWRYEGSPESEGSLDSFKDASSVLEYAEDALVWAVANGVVNGYTDGTLQPRANSTRAVVAQMLMNLLADAAEVDE